MSQTRLKPAVPVFLRALAETMIDTGFSLDNVAFRLI
jgi:hypothetical protein